MYCKLCNFRLPSEVDAVEKFELIDNKSGQHVEPKTVLQLKDIDPFEEMVAIRIIYPPIPSHLLHVKKNNFFFDFAEQKIPMHCHYHKVVSKSSLVLYSMQDL